MAQLKDTTVNGSFSLDLGGGNFRISSENNLHKGGYYHG